MLNKGSQGGPQVPDVALRNHDAGIANHMRNLAGVCPDHRTARCHGLDQHVAKLLGPVRRGVGRQDKYV